MKFRWPGCLIIAISSAVMGMSAHSSYVVEADGTNISTGAISTGSDFDFVAHDFGIEAAEAIQITLTNLSRVPNVRGNLLLLPFGATGGSSSENAAQDGMPSAEPSAATAGVTTGGSEDYSYYDEGVVGAGQNANGPAATVGGTGNGAPASLGESLAGEVKNRPAIDTNAIFRILMPAEFTSFSQMTAARFGFTVERDQNSN